MLISTASKDKTAAVWDAGSGQQVSRFEGSSGAVTGGAWSAEGRMSLELELGLLELELGLDLLELELSLLLCECIFALHMQCEKLV